MISRIGNLESVFQTRLILFYCKTLLKTESFTTWWNELNFRCDSKSLKWVVGLKGRRTSYFLRFTITTRMKSHSWPCTFTRLENGLWKGVVLSILHLEFSENSSETEKVTENLCFESFILHRDETLQNGPCVVSKWTHLCTCQQSCIHSIWLSCCFVVTCGLGPQVLNTSKMTRFPFSAVLQYCSECLRFLFWQNFHLPESVSFC